jgi:hypothetical protein
LPFLLRQESEQKRTSVQFFAQRLRHVMIRPHAPQSLLGSPRLWPRLEGVVMRGVLKMWPNHTRITCRTAVSGMRFAMIRDYFDILVYALGRAS